MNGKKWIRTWFIIIIIIPIVGGFNYLIDPLSVNKNKILKLKKAIQTTRDKKVINVKSLHHIDNLILGSSRTMRINPEDVNKFLDGSTFNFAVNSALPEDYYGILLYLERINKIPKNIIIGFDFYILNTKLPYDKRFVANKELNFIGANSLNQSNFFNNYISADTLKLSIKTIYHNIKGTKEISQFDDNNGFLYRSEKDDVIQKGKYNYLASIKSDSAGYFKGKYTRERYSDFSNERIEYLKKIKYFAKKYNIKLYTYLTPVHCYHLEKIKNHKLLNKTLIKFKSFLSTQFNYVDFMIDNEYNCKNENYYDAVHQSYYINKLIVDDIFSDVAIYGKRIKSK